MQSVKSEIYIFNLPYLTIDIGFNLKGLNNVQLPDVPSLGKEGRGRLINLSAPHGLTELVKVLLKWSDLSKDCGQGDSNINNPNLTIWVDNFG